MKKKVLVQLIILMNAGFCSSQCASNSDIETIVVNGETYELVKIRKRWSQAVACAVERGGYLAQIESQNEHDQLMQSIAALSSIDYSQTEDMFGVPSIWLGGTDQAQEGNWIWDGNNDNQGPSFWSGTSNGHPVNNAFNAWGTEIPEPDNSGGDQNYLSWRLNGNYTNATLWNDLHDSDWDVSELYFLIEYGSGSNVGLSEKNAQPIEITVSTDVITVKSDEDAIEQVVFFTIDGTKVFESVNPGTNLLKVSTNELPEGMILINVIVGSDSVVSHKIVVKK